MTETPLPKKVMVVGGGAREHQMARYLVSPEREVFVAPGNAGTSEIATNLDVGAEDINGIVKAARDNKVEFVAVGPEDPLAQGLADELESEKIPTFGHTQDRMFLEASKSEAISFMDRWDILHPDSRTFTDPDEAKNFLLNPPWKRVVIKADGLAKGKGVEIPSSITAGLKTIQEFMVEGSVGEAGRKVVLQEFEEGIEATVVGFVSNRIVLLPTARDYKKLGEGDTGPNTGGVGAYSPNEAVTPEILERVKREIIEPTRVGMILEEKPLSGPMFFGLMITPDGRILLLEYNQRFGDPEIGPQFESTRFNTTLLRTMMRTRDGTLSGKEISVRSGTSVGVVLTSEGYPKNPKTGREISGLKQAGKNAVILHGGTGKDGDRIVTTGGRVAMAVAHGENLGVARANAYNASEKVIFYGRGMRRDIAS